MSYDLTVYRISPDDDLADLSKILNGEGEIEPEAYTWAPLDESTIQAIGSIIDPHRSANTPHGSRAYGSGILSIEIYKSEASLCLPYWAKARNDFLLMLDLGVGIGRLPGIAVWDPQIGRFLRVQDRSECLMIFDKMTEVVQQRYTQSLAVAPAIRPWWRFW